MGGGLFLRSYLADRLLHTPIAHHRTPSHTIARSLTTVNLHSVRAEWLDNSFKLHISHIDTFKERGAALIVPDIYAQRACILDNQ